MRVRRATIVLLSFAVITAVHVLVGRVSHGDHVIHAIFGATYVLPAVGAAVWLGPWWGAVTALAGGLAYGVHVALGWAGETMFVVNALTTAAMVVFVGAVASALVGLRERERLRHVAAERRLEREALVQAIVTLSGALRARDDGTALHCERVATLSAALAGHVGLGQERVEIVRLAGLVHDIGKIGVRDDVLLKRAPLTSEERARIERHVLLASEILESVRGAEELAAIVAAHHEAADGTGYPSGLAGDQIPVEARLLRVADVYDSLTAERPYKEALPSEEAIAMMRAREASFDAAAFAALLAVLPAGTGVPDGSPRHSSPA